MGQAMDKKLYELLNICSRLLQDEELAPSYFLKRLARFNYNMEYAKLQKYKLMAKEG
jgi:hypothetical protein